MFVQWTVNSMQLGRSNVKSISSKLKRQNNIVETKISEAFRPTKTLKLKTVETKKPLK